MDIAVAFTLSSTGDAVPLPTKFILLFMPVGVHHLEVRPGWVSWFSIAGATSGIASQVAGTSSKRRNTLKGVKKSQEVSIVGWSINSPLLLLVLAKPASGFCQ